MKFEPQCESNASVSDREMALVPSCASNAEQCPAASMMLSSRNNQHWSTGYGRRVHKD
jgi:hypothetical protein